MRLQASLQEWRERGERVVDRLLDQNSNDVLQLDPMPNDSEHMTGFKPCFRVTCGEHRISYMVARDHVKVFLVGHRGDDAVCKAFERKYRNLSFTA